jgi:L-seryl-tRNA(Ser) seleniumtransferase
MPAAELYRSLGVRPVINCATTYTRLGGSIMRPVVTQAMADAANAFVPLPELQVAVGKRLAELTGNESAYVSNGAAAGLTLAVAAAITGDDPALMARLPNDLTGMKNEVIVHRMQRNFYDVAIRQTGARIVEIGHALETASWELDAAITERTAAVVYFAGTHLNLNTLPLEFVVERAHARGVPVIVDGAAQVPPVANLTFFTRECGADIAIFSGGKHIGGPQNSGLVVGREAIIRAMRLNGPPHQRIGRAMKVAKETMIGLMVAVEAYLAQDHAQMWQDWSDTVDRWLDAWIERAPVGMAVWRDERNEAGEPIPRVLLRFGEHAAWTRDRFVDALRGGNPAIEVVLHESTGVAFSPNLLQGDEAAQVARRVNDLLLAGPDEAEAKAAHPATAV